MKAKILSYAGANKPIVDLGKQTAAVKLAVNVVHPKVGEDLEFDEAKIVSKADKPKEEKSKADKPDKE